MSVYQRKRYDLISYFSVSMESRTFSICDNVIRKLSCMWWWCFILLKMYTFNYKSKWIILVI